MKEDAEAFEQFRGRCLDHGFPWLRRQRLLHELLARRVVRVVIVVRRRRFRLLPIKWRINAFEKIYARTHTHARTHTNKEGSFEGEKVGWR